MYKAKSCLECGKLFQPRNALHMRCGRQSEIGTCSYDRMVSSAKEAKTKDRIKTCLRCKQKFTTTTVSKTICGDRNYRGSCLYKHLSEARAAVRAQREIIKKERESATEIISATPPKDPTSDLTPRLKHLMLIRRHNQCNKW